MSCCCAVFSPRDAYQAYAADKNRLFADNPPAATAVVVSELLLPDLLVEVEAVAWRHALAKPAGV